MSEDRTLVEEATVKINSIEELKRDELLRVLETFNFARIVGLVTKPSIDESMRKLREQFDASKDGPTTGEHHSAVRSNYQKMSIGRARHSGVDRPRFMRTIYNPLWAPDIYGLRESFRAVARVRNLLGDRDINFATDKPEGGMWTAARLHHFPAGGGFMVAHKDTVLPAIYKRENAGAFFQPVLLLTERGRDYQEGGGFAEIRGRRVNYEDYTERGDIAVYDTTTVHGVEDIDPKAPYHHDKIEGRLSGLVTLFKDLDSPRE